MADTMEISEARRKLTRMEDFLKKSSRRAVRVTRYGRDSVVILDVDYFESLLETLDILSDPTALDSLERSLRDVKAGRVHNWKNVERELF